MAASMAGISLVYFSSSCNASPHAVSWDSSGTLAFASDKSVALVNPQKGSDVFQVVTTLHGHTDRVNCIKWVTTRGRGDMGVVGKLRELVSGSVDKTIRVWRESNHNEFSCVDVLTSHAGPVTCLAVTRTINEEAWLFSSGADSSLIIWKRVQTESENRFICKQSISVGRGFVFSIDCYLLSIHNKIILAFGGDDGKVNVYLEQSDQFTKAMQLIGHEDWVRDVHFTEEDSKDLLLASSSQDTYVRLWRMHPAASDDGKQLHLKGNRIAIDSKEYCITLDAVLYGHDDWVYSCRWSPLQLGPGSAQTQPLSLLSASMDKTMILWKPDPVSGVWLEQVRVGDVGGNTLGLYGGIFHPNGEIILAHGYQGSFHMWKKTKLIIDADSTGAELWHPVIAPSGHFGPVQDCCWEPVKGRYLLSVSNDQSTRLHGPWFKSSQRTWHELGRPQIHGYDIQCLAAVSSLKFVSGADEKVLRVFEAPRNFVSNFSRISGIELEINEGLPLGACVPALGLSNKAVYTVDDAATVDATEDNVSVKNSFSSEVPVFASVDLSEPPIEEHLLQNTLWPETQKLYGHGYEIYSVASNGQLIASSCKASKPEHASIRVWDVNTWQQVALLTHHSLTVTQLKFSHDGNKLLSVSRDRTWSLWEINTSVKEMFSCLAHMDKSNKTHTRIIWSCSWSHDDKYFVTASRDKRICVWGRCTVLTSTVDCGNGWTLSIPPLECPQSVTAVDFGPKMASCDRYLLAAGLENGDILLTMFTLTKEAWSPLIKFHPFLCHTSTVRCIQWQPSEEDQSELLLASCSTDHSVRIFQIKTDPLQ